MSGLNDELHQNVSMQHFIENYGYIAIFILAMAESMCIPVPSELIFVWAGALCVAGVSSKHPLNIILVIVIGLLGELAGATVAYQVGRTAGRTIVDRWGKWILLTHKDLDTAERWFHKFGTWSIPVGRMIPIVRSVISVPAGLAEMGRVKFTALTAAGSVVWISMLAGIGYGAGTKWNQYNKYFKDAEYPVIAIIVLIVGFGIYHRVRTMRAHNAS